jgi:hypothetical protein
MLYKPNHAEGKSASKPLQVPFKVYIKDILRIIQTEATDADDWKENVNLKFRW